jgi:hypothetical protein
MGHGEGLCPGEARGLAEEGVLLHLQCSPSRRNIRYSMLRHSSSPSSGYIPNPGPACSRKQNTLLQAPKVFLDPLRGVSYCAMDSEAGLHKSQQDLIGALASESSIRVASQEPFEQGVRVRPQVSRQIQLLLEHLERHLLHARTRRQRNASTHTHSRTQGGQDTRYVNKHTAGVCSFTRKRYPSRGNTGQG